MNFTSTRRILASTRRRIISCALLRPMPPPKPRSVIEARTSTRTGRPRVSTGAVGACVVSCAADGARVVGHAVGDPVGAALGDVVGDAVGASVLSQHAKKFPSTAGQH